jgi:hypothetical protein
MLCYSIILVISRLTAGETSFVQRSAASVRVNGSARDLVHLEVHKAQEI